MTLFWPAHLHTSFIDKMFMAGWWDQSIACFDEFGNFTQPLIFTQRASQEANVLSIYFFSGCLDGI